MELGIRGLEDLAAAEPDWLAAQMERFGDQHGEVARTLVAQARVQRDGPGGTSCCGRRRSGTGSMHLECCCTTSNRIPTPATISCTVSFACREHRWGLGSWHLRYHPLLVLQDHRRSTAAGGV